MTLAETRAAVGRQLDRAGAEASENTDLDRWINQGIREFICQRHNWGSMEAEYTAATVADQPDYSFPNTDNFKDVSLILLSTDGDSFSPLEEISGTQARYTYTDSTHTSRPSAWYRFGTTGYVLVPTPDVATYTQKAIVWEYPAELSGDSSSNVFTNFYSHLVEQFAVAIGFGFYFEEERFQARLAVATRELEEAIKNDRNRLAPARQSMVPSRAAGVPRSNLGHGGFVRRGRYLTGG